MAQYRSFTWASYVPINSPTNSSWRTQHLHQHIFFPLFLFSSFLSWPPSTSSSPLPPPSFPSSSLHIAHRRNHSLPHLPPAQTLSFRVLGQGCPSHHHPRRDVRPPIPKQHHHLGLPRCFDVPWVLRSIPVSLSLISALLGGVFIAPCFVSKGGGRRGWGGGQGALSFLPSFFPYSPEKKTLRLFSLPYNHSFDPFPLSWVCSPLLSLSVSLHSTLTEPSTLRSRAP